MRKPYMHYPRFLYNEFNDSRIVKNPEEQQKAESEGWYDFEKVKAPSTRARLLADIDAHEKAIALIRANLAELELVEIGREEQAATVADVAEAEGMTRDIEEGMSPEERNQREIDRLFPKETVQSPDTGNPEDAEKAEVHQCGICGRSCASRVGLISHMRTHAQKG